MQKIEVHLINSVSGVRIAGTLPARVTLPLNMALLQEVTVSGVNYAELTVQSIYCALDADFIADTAPAMLITQGVTMREVADGVCFSIPFQGATAALRELSGNSPASPVYEEIGGYDENGLKIFSFRFPVVVMAEVYPGNGTPEIAGDPDYYNAAQIEALMARPLVYEYSADGENWHNELEADDTVYRVKNGTKGLFSEAQNIPYGATGAAGATRYPVTACFGNETYQIVCYLDATHSMTFAGYIAEPVSKIDLYVVSANTAYTGNIVLKVGAESFTVPVGAAVGKVTLDLSTQATGIISIVRDTAAASDTLSDGTDDITAYVVDWSVQ